MRLIDADSLKDRLQILAYDDWNQGCVTTWAEAYKEIADMVDEFPTVDVPERNVGKWIWQGSISEGCWVCSECKHQFYKRLWGNENYCPNCGAKMDGKEIEDIPIEYFENGGI